MGITEKVVIDGRVWTVVHTSKEPSVVEQATAAPGELRETRKRRRPWFSSWRTVR
jgi:hypothetical protein